MTTFVPSHIAVNDVLHNHWDWKVPVDVYRIADRLGIVIEPFNPFNGPSGISGSAEINTNNQRVIRFNSTDSENRQRFTIAHELGHFLLGHVTPDTIRYRSDKIENFSSSIFDPMEAQANDFAANLLMPAPAIDHFINNSNANSIGELAESFRVSEAAMYYRLKNLNLL